MTRKGVPNVTVFAYTHPTRCQACQSTRRTAYTNRTEELFHTTIGGGMPVTHIVRANTSCLNCGNARIDTTYHYQPDGGPIDQAAEDSPRLAADLEFDGKLNQLRQKAETQPYSTAKQGKGSKA